MKTWNPELERLSRTESLQLLATAPVGRVVFTTGGLPAVEPVIFLLDGDRVLFRAREGSRLATVGHGVVVGFQADQLEPETRSGWSVTIVGDAHLLDEDEATRRWANGTRDDVIAIDTAFVTGRRLTTTRD